MGPKSIYIEPDAPDIGASNGAAESTATTIVNITNYYAGTEARRADTDLVRGGIDDSVLY